MSDVTEAQLTKLAASLQPSISHALGEADISGYELDRLSLKVASGGVRP
jgi:hypothetical protein